MEDRKNVRKFVFEALFNLMVISPKTIFYMHLKIRFKIDSIKWLFDPDRFRPDIKGLSINAAKCFVEQYHRQWKWILQEIMFYLYCHKGFIRSDDNTGCSVGVFESKYIDHICREKLNLSVNLFPKYRERYYKERAIIFGRRR